MLRLGFTKVMIPKTNNDLKNKYPRINILEVSNINEAVAIVFEQSKPKNTKGIFGELTKYERPKFIFCLKKIEDKSKNLVTYVPNTQ